MILIIYQGYTPFIPPAKIFDIATFATPHGYFQLKNFWVTAKREDKGTKLTSIQGSSCWFLAVKVVALLGIRVVVLTAAFDGLGVVAFESG